ncbi:G8 domain-containing protein [Deinococcus sp.]|uniref:G8 domain-containing protein n=1 Tax=Deinococcus sp. TaxID=47478 RepID=UPI003B593057
MLRSPSLPLALLVSALLIGCGKSDSVATPSTPAQPGQPAAPTPGQPVGTPPAPAPTPEAKLPRGDWSSASTWPGGKVPAAGEIVSLPAGKRVVLDVSPPDLAGIIVPPGSALEFAEQDLTLKAEWIMVHGELRIGSAEKPFVHRADIVLTDSKPGENIMDMGDRVLGVMDGTLELHGQARRPWTRLSATAQAGAPTLTLQDAPDWQAGDHLTLTSTDFSVNQTEEVTVKSVSGKQVTLAAPLKYTHWGADSTFGGKTVSERAEVGLLSRNVKISASEDALKTGLGVHLMVMGKGQARIEGAELMRVGQRNALRRYPVHFHQLGSSPTSYVRGSSIHTSFNRCIVVHGTRDVWIQNNVTYDSVGHCLFLEDGDETGNTISGNLLTLVRKPDSKRGEKPLLDSDKRPAAFWISHPANKVSGNVAAGVEGTGFWYALPEHPTGLATVRGATIWPRRTPLGTFENNLAHSGDRGLNVDNGPKPDGTTGPSYFEPLKDPANAKSDAVPATFNTFSAYKQRDQGVWLRGRGLTLRGAVLVDNAIGVTLAADKSTLLDSLLVGETANLGQPESWEEKGAGGRSLPRPWEATFPIRGYQFYDGHVTVQNSSFAAFKPDSVRQASGLGYLMGNSFSLRPFNNAQGVKWLDDSTRAYFPPAEVGKDGDLAATFLDTDGSVTGKAGRSVTTSPLLRGASDCAAQAAWNASVCAGNYLRFWLDEVNGGNIAPLRVTNAGGTGIDLVGTPSGFTFFTTTVRGGERYTLAPNGTSGHLRLGFEGAKTGDVLSFTLPVGGDPALYRDWWISDNNRMKKVALADLPAASGDSYALESGKLHLKMVVQKDRDFAAVDICASTLCK